VASQKIIYFWIFPTQEKRTPCLFMKCPHCGFEFEPDEEEEEIKNFDVITGSKLRYKKWTVNIAVNYSLNPKMVYYN